MQCVRCRQEAAGEVHAPGPGAGAAARRPEPGERAGAGGQPPSPAGMELSTWSSGIKLSLGLLLCGALLPPEVPGKEGKRGTALVPPPGGLGLGRAGRGGPLWGAGSRSWPTAWGRRDNTDGPGGELECLGCLGRAGGCVWGRQRPAANPIRLLVAQFTGTPGMFSPFLSAPSQLKHKCLRVSSDPREFCLCLP